MGEYWNENENPLDSILSHTIEPDSNQDEVIGHEGMKNEVEIAEEIKMEAAATEDPQNDFGLTEEDSTYHWVNPKLAESSSQAQQSSGEPQANINQPQQESWYQEAITPEVTPNNYETYQFATYEKQGKASGKKKKKSGGLGRKFALSASLAVVFGLIAGLTFQGVNVISNRIGGTKEPTIEQKEITTTEATSRVAEGVITPAAQPTSTAGTYSVADVAQNATPSVVAISNLGVQETQSIFGGVQAYEGESSGSGIIVGQNDEELLVATNNHVIAGAKKITVTFIDNAAVEAQVKGTDVNNDLAVVAVKLSDISEETRSKIKTATIGSSDDLVVGEQVVAIGNALGYGQSVTSGYVSALDREVTVDNITANLIQTDAAINPGNSGGALLNMRGELIGINAVKFASNQVEGMGYAIPVSTAEPILGDLMNRVTRARVDDEKASYLGVSCRNVTAESAQMYDMPTGVFIADVTKGSASEKAGIQKGDIITKFDGAPIGTYDELVNSLGYYEAGETVEIIVQRAEGGEYKEQTLSITLDARPADLPEQSSQQQQMPGIENGLFDGAEQ